MHCRVNEGLKVLAQKIFPPLSGLIRSIRQKMHFLRSCELELQIRARENFPQTWLHSHQTRPSPPRVQLPAPERQCCGSGFNQVSGSGSGSRRAKMTQKSWKNVKNFMFWNAGCSLSRAECFFCNLDVLYGGLEISKLLFLIQKKFNFFSCKFFSIFGHKNPGSGSGSVSA